MSQTFLCYLHRPALFTPEVRFVACETENLLPDAIWAEVAKWGAFDAVDVYNDAHETIFRFNRAGGLPH